MGRPTGPDGIRGPDGIQDPDGIGPGPDGVAKVTLTIRVHRRKDGSSDVYGVLLDPDPNVATPLWGHISSSVDFLKGDLTTHNAARREHLAKRFPDGYDLVLVEAASNEEPAS